MNIMYFGGYTWNLFHEMTGSAGSLNNFLFYVSPHMLVHTGRIK